MAYQSDPRYQRFYPQAYHTAEQAQDFVQMFLDQQAEQPHLKFQLALTLKSTGQLIGNCGIRRRRPGAHEADIGCKRPST